MFSGSLNLNFNAYIHFVQIMVSVHSTVQTESSEYPGSALVSYHKLSRLKFPSFLDWSDEREI